MEHDWAVLPFLLPLSLQAETCAQRPSPLLHLQLPKRCLSTQSNMNKPLPSAVTLPPSSCDKFGSSPAVMAAVLAGRVWAWGALWRGVLVLSCSGLIPKLGWRGREGVDAAPEQLDGDGSLWRLATWWVPCLGSWLPAGVLWFIPDVLIRREG